VQATSGTNYTARRWKLVASGYTDLWISARATLEVVMEECTQRKTLQLRRVAL
jgi:hypothetical protein